MDGEEPWRQEMVTEQKRSFTGEVLHGVDHLIQEDMVPLLVAGLAASFYVLEDERAQRSVGDQRQT